MDRKLEWLTRFGAVCGILFGLSLGIAGAIEAFTGETAATSFIVGLGVAGFGVPALFAFHLRQADASGRFGAVAAAVNIIGLGLFAGASFAYNVVLFFVEPAVSVTVLDGPSHWVILGGGATFIIGTLLFGASMIRTGVHPRRAAAGYTSALVLLALLGNLPDSLLSSANHVFACAALICLSRSVWRATSSRMNPGPVPSL
ncbi:hypothetical protein ABZ729_21195 [Streptomyces sp. NPDC006678]|uniref:hypothetical protein n=1 Tax=Streptomyces sp. NPDC006678 TaxID=3157185 RepID=UPI0033E8BF2F